MSDIEPATGHVLEGHSADRRRPRSVLICHHDAPLDVEGLSAWLATFSDLVGLVVITEERQRALQRARREKKRVGTFRFLDVLAFRFYYRVMWASRDSSWEQSKLAHLRETYGSAPEVPTFHTTSPNSEEAEAFLRSCAPDIVIARCKFLLKEQVFSIPTTGTFVLHPGICPQYRNAHGGFWALANDDVDNVGTTLLKIDRGIDTGPVYGWFRCDFDEVSESHIVIQQRTLFDNLDAVSRRFTEIFAGSAAPENTQDLPSKTWGQPWLSKYLRWKRKARARRLRTGGRRL